MIVMELVLFVVILAAVLEVHFTKGSFVNIVIATSLGIYVSESTSVSSFNFLNQNYVQIILFRSIDIY